MRGSARQASRGTEEPVVPNVLRQTPPVFIEPYKRQGDGEEVRTETRRERQTAVAVSLLRAALLSRDKAVYSTRRLSGLSELFEDI